MHPPRLYLRRLSHSLSDARLSFLRGELQDLSVAASLESEPPPPEEPKQLQEITAAAAAGGGRRVEISHQWPEWAQLIEILFKNGYLDPTALDGPKNSNLIQTAALNFARDRFDLIRYFSRRDIHIMAGAGCPSLDRKIVNSGKRLRAHVGIDEGDVCSSCSLRGNCEKAYLKAREDECGRTVDVMQFLLVYGLDLATASSDSQASCNKLVKESVRNLMKEMVELCDKEFSSRTLNETSGLDKKSTGFEMPRAQKNVLMKQGDWLCPKCNFLNFAKNIKCLRCNGIFQERLDRLREEREHLPLKKGDWICDKCNFLNFAKNTRCLQCKEKPPKRDLHPGEWECPLCNYINFRKNIVCLKCDWNRSKASSSVDVGAESRHDSKRTYLKDSGHTFVRCSSETSSLQKRSSDEEGTSFWSREVDETDKDGDNNNSWNRFADTFPILGGKSVISKDLRERERWKWEMSKSRGVPLKGLEEDVDEMDHKSPADTKLDESSDEDDVAGWFREKK